MLSMVLHVQGISSDIDGSLIDSTTPVERSWRTWAEGYRVDADEVLRICHGRRTEDVVQRSLMGSHQRRQGTLVVFDHPQGDPLFGELVLGPEPTHLPSGGEDSSYRWS
ncbi:hypothetical protein [Mycobacterium paraffinicum]|uniref:hypothetical protein n=1 Tax=Mycobacterium paraffinicum TaxID=53378 RepID=UPI0021F25FAC|nr:hypothetical protein [Mycobacterium paraffinicum]MCV7309404.1 hypothetical protein [Mycobacterium paraffinicum]